VSLRVLAVASTVYCLLEFVHLGDKWDWWLVMSASSFTLLGLKYIWDCLAKRHLLESCSKWGPNEEGREETLGISCRSIVVFGWFVLVWAYDCSALCIYICPKEHISLYLTVSYELT
jgi:hypothetical protein